MSIIKNIILGHNNNHPSYAYLKIVKMNKYNNGNSLLQQKVFLNFFTPKMAQLFLVYSEIEYTT